MTRKILLRIFAALLIVGAAAAAFLLREFKGSAVKEEQIFLLSKRTSYDQFVRELMPHIRHHRAFEFYADHLNLRRSFKPGRYTLRQGMNVIEIARMFSLGMQTPVRISFQNARIPSHLAAKLAPQLDADSAELMTAFTSRPLAEELGLDSLTLFSIFIPNTYELYWTTTPEQFVRHMKKEYDRFWNEPREGKRKATGLSRLEVVTLASIVTEETRAREEMPRIAGVYMNRLRRGIPLQADPTVKYAMQDFGLRRILHRHLKYPSPYNTYLNRGLPPSPICLPSITAVDAVLNYEHHDYLYFCARPTFDGRHNFSRTLSEHNINARAYSAALNRRKIK